MEPQFIPPQPESRISNMDLAGSLSISAARESHLDSIAKNLFDEASRDCSGYVKLFERLEAYASNYNEMLYLTFMVAGHHGYAALRASIVRSTVREFAEFLNIK